MESYSITDKRQRHSYLIIFFVAHAVFVFFYYQYLITHLVDFPFLDDFRAILRTVVLWVEDKSAANFFSLIMAQNNEHKVLLVKAAAIIDYEIEGVINFRHLALIGNIFLALMPLVFLINNKSPAYFLVAILPLFFCARLHGSSFWTMASLSNLPVMFFACLSALFFLHPSRALNWLAIPVLYLATFSQGNGIVMYLILTVYSGFKKDRYLLVGYLASFLIALVLYFYDWHAKSTNYSFNVAISNPMLAAKFVFALIGNIGIEADRSIIIGIALFTLWAFTLYIKREVGAKDLIIAFILVSALMAALNRLVFGLKPAIDTRYAIYSLMLVATLGLKLLDLINVQKQKFAFFILFSVLTVWYYQYSWRVLNIEIQNYFTHVSSLRIDRNENFINLADPRHLQESIKTLQRCRELGIYTPPHL